MTITGGSALAKDEIDRMVKEAEAHAAEDAKRREEADLRNTAEQQSYSIEKLLKENSEKLPEDVVAPVRTDLEELQEALKGEDIDRVKTAQERLTTSSQKSGEALDAAQAAEQGAQGGPEGGFEGATADDTATEASDEDVVDAEIVDDEDERK